jgi:hypothetical protein
MTEKWKPVVGYEGIYEVSDQGRVRGLDRTDRSGKLRKGGIRKQKTSRDGYKTIGLRNVFIRTFSVHRLVLGAFVGPCPEGMECCHFPDNDPSNNNLDNLRWDTPENNHADRWPHDLNRARLSQHDIPRIFELSRIGNSAKKISKLFSVNPSTIDRVISGQTWKHVPRPQ